jgi:hypothetical protein
MTHAGAIEVNMQSKFMRWVGALVCLSIFLRAVFYIGSKIYVTGGLEPFDWVAVPIGLVALYLSYMFFKKIFRKRGQVHFRHQGK